MSDIMETIEALYSALDAHDSEGTAACYHPDARFRDPLFDLHGEEIGAMWRMFTDRSADLRASIGDIRVVGHDKALARWRAQYIFTGTGRSIVNEVRAAYRFDDDGRIIDHVDAFDLQHWASQALGSKGTLLSRLPGGAGVLRRRASRQLGDFLTKSDFLIKRQSVRQ
jgi:hypothetical protein